MQSLRLILKSLRYFSPVWVFASLNIMIGTWVLYIPHVKESMALDDGQLGVALFFYALGILVVIPFVPAVNKKLGIGRYTIIGVTLYALAFMVPLLMESYILLCASLFVAGMFGGSTDIAMNALVSEIEKQDKVNFMSVAHGFFSLGGVIGAGLGSAMLIGLLEPHIHMIVAATFVIITNLLLAKNYFPIDEAHEKKEKTKYNLLKFIPLLGVAFIGFAIMGSEGAVEHWSKLYLLEVIQVSSEKIAGYGFVLFSATMTLGRFLGDGISEKYGSDKVMIGGISIAIFAYLAILSGNMWVSIAGFGILGLGLSVIVPETFRIAGKAKGISASASISFVAGIGFVGFLLGPVFLGLISDFAGLKFSFGALMGAAVIGLVLAISRKRFSE